MSSKVRLSRISTNLSHHRVRVTAELYKQFKNRGPIMKWPREFNDAEIQFEMKAMNCPRVVFTLNGDDRENSRLGIQCRLLPGPEVDVGSASHHCAPAFPVRSVRRARVGKKGNSCSNYFSIHLGAP